MLTLRRPVSDVPFSRLPASPAGVFVLAFALVLPGCASQTPKSELAVPPVAAAFRYGAASPATAVPAQWASAYGSGELTRLVAMGAAENLDIAAARARLMQAEAQAMNAASGLYPQISGSVSASGVQSSGTIRRADPPYPITKSQTFQLGLSASYLIDIWGEARSSALAGVKSAEASRFDVDVARLATSAAIANAYINLLTAQERLRLARSNGKVAGQVLEAMKARLGAGTGTALDVAQQDSVVAQQMAAQPVFVQNAQQGQVLIATLLGQTPESYSVKGGSLMALRVPAIRPGVPSQLLLRRPDLAAAEARIAAAGASVEAARAAFFPNLSLTAQGGFESMLLKTLIRPEAVAASVAASALQKIFTGFQLEAQLELQKGRHGEAMILYRKAIIQAFADVENALIAVRQSAAQENAQQRVVEAARRAYRITQERLREGTIDMVSVLNVQQTLFNAEDALVQARARRLLATVSLYQALGGGWTLPEAQP